MGLKLGDVSPLAGMLTGEGLTGKLIQQGVGGIIPMAIAKSATKSRKEEEEEEAKKKLGPGMKKGGAVSVSRRADGCCKKGKTRGKIV
jgi:hypothetical protein